jgi:hypothetical protein
MPRVSSLVASQPKTLIHEAGSDKTCRDEKAKTEAFIAAIGDGISIQDTNY